MGHIVGGRVARTTRGGRRRRRGSHTGGSRGLPPLIVSHWQRRPKHQHGNKLSPSIGCKTVRFYLKCIHQHLGTNCICGWSKLRASYIGKKRLKLIASCICTLIISNTKWIPQCPNNQTISQKTLSVLSISVKTVKCEKRPCLSMGLQWGWGDIE